MLRWFLLFIPVTIGAHAFDAPSVVTFALAALALIPLSGLIGEATEALAARIGESWGGFLNATFGNAAEVIIAVVALRAGAIELVKNSLIGSAIGNLLLVLGLSVIVGGVRYRTLKFRREFVGTSMTMLFIAMFAMAIPTIAHYIPGDGVLEHASGMTAIILLALYVLSVIRHFRTPDDEATLTEADAPETLGVHWGVPRSLATLAGAAGAVCLVSEILVHHLEGFCGALGWTPTFVGLIIVPIVGNVAEHWVAVQVARKNRMDLSLAVSVGSATQIALFVTPVCVFAAMLLGQEFTLVFPMLSLVTVAGSVFFADKITQDGRSNWLEGAALLAVYAIFAVLCFTKT